MNKSKIIKDALNVRYKPSRNIKFWLKDLDLVKQVDILIKVIEAHGLIQLPENIEYIKPINKRLAFKVKPNSKNEKEFVCKVFTLQKLRLQIKYYWMKHNQYRFAEAANLIMASKLGMKVPRIYGYGNLCGPLGLIKKDFVIIEYLTNHVSVENLLKENAGNHAVCAEILDRTIPAFLSHYKAKCNNWDINPGSIMLNMTDKNQEPFILDFEYIGFHKSRNLHVLSHMVANFAKGVTTFLQRQQIDSWVNKLLDTISIEDGDREIFIKSFNNYMNIRDIPREFKVKIHKIKMMTKEVK